MVRKARKFYRKFSNNITHHLSPFRCKRFLGGPVLTLYSELAQYANNTPQELQNTTKVKDAG